MWLVCVCTGANARTGFLRHMQGSTAELWKSLNVGAVAVESAGIYVWLERAHRRRRVRRRARSVRGGKLERIRLWFKCVLRFCKLELDFKGLESDIDVVLLQLWGARSHLIYLLHSSFLVALGLVLCRDAWQQTLANLTTYKEQGIRKFKSPGTLGLTDIFRHTFNTQ